MVVVEHKPPKNHATRRENLVGARWFICISHGEGTIDKILETPRTQASVNDDEVLGKELEVREIQRASS
jgi:hypothetical protein